MVFEFSVNYREIMSLITSFSFEVYTYLIYYYVSAKIYFLTIILKNDKILKKSLL